MKIKCTIGKDGKKYYFKNGQRISKSNIKNKKLKKIKCKSKTKSKSKSKSKSGTYCRIGKDGKKYYFKNGKRISKTNIKSRKLRKMKCTKTNNKRKPKLVKKVGKDNKVYVYDTKTKTRVKKDGSKKKLRKTGYYCIIGNDGKKYYFKDGQRVKSGDIPKNLNVECEQTTRVKKTEKFKDQPIQQRDVVGDCKLRIRDVNLNDYQEKCVDFMKRNNNLLVCHATGLGKTLTAIVASQCFLDEHNQDGMVLIVCPSSVVEQFKEQIIRFYGDKDLNRYQVISYNNMRINKDIINCKNKFMILDEAHTIKNYKSKTYESIVQCAMLCRKRMLLTATPYINDIRDFISLLNVLNGNQFLVGSTYPLKDQENGPQYEYYINHKLHLDDNKDFVQLLVKKLNIDYVENKDTRFFPKLNEQYLEVQMSKIWQDKYTKLISGKKLFDIQFSNPESFYNGHRRAVNDTGGDEYFSMKLSAVLDIIKGGKTLIYTNWITFGIKPIQKFLDENDITYKSFSGQLDSKSRLKLVKMFNSDEIDVLIITAAGGEGLDLKGVRNIIILDPVWNHAKLKQIIGRGVRYKSHEHLPESERIVNVYKMVLIEKDKGNNWLCENNKSVSGDVILYRIIEKKRRFDNQLKYIYNRISI
tara:strand:- start:989 stop:2908 length:1920 start_codon:yes stop_codon:yes gene_type:complete